ncbi:MAG: serine/threonine-protein kinase, partial [Candidatus Eremiobacterota bacterium]
MDPPIANGTVLRGRYKILSALGKGSFAWVYLARDTQWKGNLVALKQIRTDIYTPEEYRALNQNFLQEAAFLMTMSHRGLPRVVEFFAEGTSYYLALEWLPGKTLEESVQGRETVAELQAVRWGLELCDVLAYLHEQKPYPVLLGDLKPSNIIVKYDGDLAVIDFGLARHSVPTAVKRRFSLVSPGFSPPEQYTGGTVDPRGDIYSLGATLYWCMTRLDLEKFRFQVPPIRQVRYELSHKLEEILATCLMPDAHKRFSDVRSLEGHLRGLRAYLEDEKQAVKPSDIL